MTTLPDHLRGDGPCQDCGSDNIVWFTDSPLWNRALGGPEATDDPGGLLCIPCFVVRAAAAGIMPTGWYLGPLMPAADHHARTAAEDFHDSVCTGPGVPAGFTCSHPSHARPAAGTEQG